MKKKIFCSFIFFFFCFCCISAQNKVENINYSDFGSIDQTDDRPIVILFGSNYCRYSKEALKILKRVANKYGDQVNFLCVNCDTDENYEWLKKVFKYYGLDREFGQVGTPVWLFMEEMSKYPIHDTKGRGWYPQSVLYHYELRTLGGPLKESELDNFVKDILGKDW